MKSFDDNKFNDNHVDDADDDYSNNVDNKKDVADNDIDCQTAKTKIFQK